MIRHWLWLPFVFGAAPAYAHAPIAGIQGFYAGLLHPFSTPSQALLMLGIGLMIGGFALPQAWRIWSAFVVACFIGMFVGSVDLNLDTALFTVAFVACGLAALAWGRFALFAVAVAAVGGSLIGSASIPDGGETAARAFTMAGSMVGANVGLLYIFGIVHILHTRYTWPWVPIAFRVAAAWVGAMSLLMLALSTIEPALPN